MNQDLLYNIGTWVDLGNEINNNIKTKLISKAQGTDYTTAFEKIYYVSYNNISRKEISNNLQELKKAKILLNNREEKNTLESFISDSEILFVSQDSEPDFNEIKSYIAKKVKKPAANTSQNGNTNNSDSNSKKTNNQEEQRRREEENRRREEQRKQQEEQRRQQEEQRRQQEEQRRQNEARDSKENNNSNSEEEKKRKKAERERKKREAEKAAEEARQYEAQYQNEARKKQEQRNKARNKDATKKRNKKTINKFWKIVFTIAVLLFLFTEGELITFIKQKIPFVATTEQNNRQDQTATDKPDNAPITNPGKTKETQKESKKPNKTCNDIELERTNDVEPTDHESSESSKSYNNKNNTSQVKEQSNGTQPATDKAQLKPILETLKKQFDASNGKSQFETSAEYGIEDNIIKIDKLIKEAESIDPNNREVVAYRKKYEQIMSKHNLL